MECPTVTFRGRVVLIFGLRFAHKWKGPSYYCFFCIPDIERKEEDRMPKKIFTQELEGTRRGGRPRKKMKRGSRKRSSSAGSERVCGR